MTLSVSTVRHDVATPAALADDVPLRQWLQTDDDAGGENVAEGFWHLLIVDDDQNIHDVTRLVLGNECMLGRKLVLHHATSATMARQMLAQSSDYAVILLDVVMESDHAGLQLVDYIRNTLNDRLVRIILRTGQPGMAPQKQVVANYDINDYCHKTEATSEKLYSAVHLALSAYRDLSTLAGARQDLSHALAHSRRSEQRFRLTMSGSPIGLADVDLNGRFCIVNPALCNMLGYTEAELLSKTFQDITHPDDLPADLAHLEQLTRGEIATYRIEKRYFHKDGHLVHIQLDVGAIRDDNGVVVGYIGQIQNIDERRHHQERLQATARRLSLATQIGGIGVWQWDVADDKVSWDAQMYSIYGIPSGQAISRDSWDRLIHADDQHRIQSLIAQAQASRSAAEGSFRIVHPATGLRYLEASVDVILDARGQPLAFVGVNRDVTERRLAEDQLLQRQSEIIKLSQTDALTGIANRRKLDEHLESEVGRFNRYGGTLTVAMADLDHFKRINDEFGHEVGDVIIKTFARIMMQHVRCSDLVARYGGEEFVVIMPHSSGAEARAVTERMRTYMEALRVAPLAAPVTVSFGIAELRPGESAAALLSRADKALYRAKFNGRNNVVVDPHHPGLTSAASHEPLASRLLADWQPSANGAGDAQ